MVAGMTAWGEEEGRSRQAVKLEVFPKLERHSFEKNGMSRSAAFGWMERRYDVRVESDRIEYPLQERNLDGLLAFLAVVVVAEDLLKQEE